MAHTELLAPLPYREPDRVVRIRETHLALGIDDFTASMPNFRSGGLPSPSAPLPGHGKAFAGSPATPLRHQRK